VHIYLSIGSKFIIILQVHFRMNSFPENKFNAVGMTRNFVLLTRLIYNTDKTLQHSIKTTSFITKQKSTDVKTKHRKFKKKRIFSENLETR